MKGFIADSITIRVGQGILTIPRKINVIQKGENSSVEFEELEHFMEPAEQISNDSKERDKYE